MIDCGQINSEAEKLKALFKKCYALKASDLRVLVDLIQSVYACGSGDQNNFVRQLLINENDLPSGYTYQDIVDYVLLLPEEERTILETDSKWNIIIFEAGS